MFFKVKRKKIHVRNLAFQIYLDLYIVADLTFDPVLETRHFDKNKLFLLSYNTKLPLTFGFTTKNCLKKLFYNMYAPYKWQFQDFYQYKG
jgi:hypothetical protein